MQEAYGPAARAVERHVRSVAVERRRTTALVLGACVVLLAACGGGEAPAPMDPTGGQETFHAGLGPLNGSGARGRAILSRLGSTLRIQLNATGLAPGQAHVQHLHRLETGEPGECPERTADANGDGVTGLEESLPVYGPVSLQLAPFPRSDRRGSIDFQATYELPAELEPLTDRVIVLYGLNIRGVYDPTVPVACGPIG
jgi:hypothetical protein